MSAHVCQKPLSVSSFLGKGNILNGHSALKSPLVMENSIYFLELDLYLIQDYKVEPFSWANLAHFI